MSGVSAAPIVVFMVTFHHHGGLNGRIPRRPNGSAESLLAAGPSLERWRLLRAPARLALAAPRRIIALALLVMVGAAIFGLPIAQSLSPGGFQDPKAESARASRQLSEKFGQGDMRVIFAVSSDAGADSRAARAAGTHLVAELTQMPFVARVTSAWTAPPRLRRR